MSTSEDLFGITYEKDRIIFKQDDLGDTMYIIQSGAVEISQLQKGRKAVLALLEHGDFFGEMALIDKHPRTATASTLSRCRLLPLTRSSLTEHIQSNPGVASSLLKTICLRIAEVNLLLRTNVQNDEKLRFSLESKRRESSRVSQRGLDADRSERCEGLSHESALDMNGAEKPVPEIAASPASFSFDIRECVPYEPGSIIFSQGDPGGSMFIIVEGEVEIVQGPDSDECILASLGPNDFFGETAIITDQPRTASARAAKHTLLLPIHKDEFCARIQRDPEMAVYILQGLILRLRSMLTMLSTPEKYLELMLHTVPPLHKKRSRIKTAIVSLSTCGGCSAVFLDDQALLTDLLRKVKISYCPMLMDSEELGEVEVALVDGMVRVKEDEEKLIEARHKSRYLIAWGTCASFGGIPAFANQYELEELIKESYGQTRDAFAYYLSGVKGIDPTTFQDQGRELSLLRRASKLDEFVHVDYYIPGCPPMPPILMQFLNEFTGEGEVYKPKSIVCSECSRKPVKAIVDHFRVSPQPAWDLNHCFVSRGSICMGFVTKGGCGATCPRGGLPCWGCRGPSEVALRKMAEGNSFDEFLYHSLISRHKHLEEQIRLALKIFRKSGNSSLKFNQYFVQDRARIR